MHENFDECALMVKFAELYADGKHDSIVAIYNTFTIKPGR